MYFSQSKEASIKSPSDQTMSENIKNQEYSEINHKINNCETALHLKEEPTAVVKPKESLPEETAFQEELQEEKTSILEEEQREKTAVEIKDENSSVDNLEQSEQSEPAIELEFKECCYYHPLSGVQITTKLTPTPSAARPARQCPWTTISDPICPEAASNQDDLLSETTFSLTTFSEGAFSNATSDDTVSHATLSGATFSINRFAEDTFSEATFTIADSDNSGSDVSDDERTPRASNKGRFKIAGRQVVIWEPCQIPKLPEYPDNKEFSNINSIPSNSELELESYQGDLNELEVTESSMTIPSQADAFLSARGCSDLDNTIPQHGDFRSFLELDVKSMEILKRIANVSPKENFSNSTEQLDTNICKYLTRFYGTRAKDDETIFLWHVTEGFYPTQMLINNPELSDLRFKALQEHTLAYTRENNKWSLCNFNKKLALTDLMAQYMIKCYFRSLYERATQQECLIENRLLLRARFAVSNVEQFMIEHNRNVLKDEVDCLQLYNWCLIHERRMCLLYDESLINVKIRAEQALNGKNRIMYLNNMHMWDDFYKTGKLPSLDVCIKPAELPKQLEKKMLQDYPCPMQSCQHTVNNENMMAHFLSHHCSQLQELWLNDRKVVFLHPHVFTPDRTYCLHVLALLQDSLSIENPRPCKIRNFGLAPQHLFYVGHLPCLIMLSVWNRTPSSLASSPLASSPLASSPLASSPLASSPLASSLLPSSPLASSPLASSPLASCPLASSSLASSLASSSSSAPPVTFNGEDLLFVFWVASIEDYPSNLGCRMYIYSSIQSTYHSGVRSMDFIEISEFKDVNHLFDNFAGNYLAIDYEAMQTLTNNFKELFYVDVRYINKNCYSPKDSDDDDVLEFDDDDPRW